MPTFLLMDDSANELYFVFWCGHSRDSDGYYYVTASWVPYHIHTTCCDHSPCVDLGFSTSRNIIYLIISMVTAKNKTKKKTVPWLSSSRSDWHVLQRRCQPTPTPICIKRFTASVPTEANYFISEYHTQLAKINFDKIFDLTAGVYFYFFSMYFKGRGGVNLNLKTI